jgi:hypothetical protein
MSEDLGAIDALPHIDKGSCFIFADSLVEECLHGLARRAMRSCEADDPLLHRLPRNDLVMQRLACRL